MADNFAPGDATGCITIKRGGDGSNANAGKAGPLCFACDAPVNDDRKHCARCGACLPQPRPDARSRPEPRSGAAVEYAPKHVGTCQCGEPLDRSGDCEMCTGSSTGCDDLHCAHDHCESCGSLLNTINCDENEEPFAVEPHSSRHGYCQSCGDRAGPKLFICRGSWPHSRLPEGGGPCPCGGGPLGKLHAIPAESHSAEAPSARERESGNSGGGES